MEFIFVLRFISLEESEVIRKAIGLKNTDYHGTTFHRSQSGDLLITYKLKSSVTEYEIKKGLNSHFWFDKESKVGNLDRIRGRVIYPRSRDEEYDSNYETGYLDLNKTNNQHKDRDVNIKEIRIEGSNYDLSEDQILEWIELYGRVQSEIQEEAVVLVDEVDKAENLVGTGVYLVTARLDRQIPNVVPIQGKKIKVWYPGVKKQCKNCFGYHKKNDIAKRCEVVCFEDYRKSFMECNPRVPARMCSAYSETDGTKEVNTKKSESKGDPSGYNSDTNNSSHDEEEEVEEATKKEQSIDSEKDKEITDESIINMTLSDFSESEMNWLIGQDCKSETEALLACRKLLADRGLPAVNC